MLSALQLRCFKQNLKPQFTRQPKYGIKGHSVLHTTQLVESERENGQISKKMEEEEVDVSQVQDGYILKDEVYRPVPSSCRAEALCCGRGQAGGADGGGCACSGRWYYVAFGPNLHKTTHIHLSLSLSLSLSISLSLSLYIYIYSFKACCSYSSVVMMMWGFTS